MTYKDDLVEVSWCYTQYFMRNGIDIEKIIFFST